MTLKFSEEQLAKWGCASQEDIVSALDKSKESSKPEPAATQPETPAAVAAVVPDAILARLNALETTVKTLSAESILASVAVEAKRVASLEVSAAIARSGGAALQQKSDPADAGAPAKAQVDPNDFGAQYDASPSIRDEFLSKTSYIKYREALRDGRIRERASELTKN
jgi:hypothetical protein